MISESLPDNVKTIFKYLMLIKCLRDTILRGDLLALRNVLQRLPEFIDQHLGWFFTNGYKSRVMVDDTFWD